MSNIYRVVNLNETDMTIEKYLSRNLGYRYSDHTLCIKMPDGTWFEISGDAKQNKFTAGDNINTDKLYNKDVASLTDDIDIDTWELESENPEQPTHFKGLTKLSTVEDSAYLPLIKVGSGDLLGGEIILSVTVDGRTTFNHVYIVNIADGAGYSKGCSIQGGSGSNVKAAVVEVNGETIGLYYQSTTGTVPTKLQVWFSGWNLIKDDSLLNTKVDEIKFMKFLARA